MTDSEGSTEDETSSASSPSPMEGIITSQPSDEDSDAYMSDSQNDVAENVELEETAASRARRPAGDGLSEDEDEPPIKNPSTDICGDLENALDGELSETFTGSFAYERTYLDAPIPGLNILANDIGPIGLPLNEREANVVKSGCKQAPFGKGERTVVDKSVRDTWEMDASMVQFNNPAWDDYVKRALKDVCDALGVDMKVSKPHCELYKLLLYETGSHTEKVGTMFATIIIVLPSPFTGGAAHLSHGNLSEVFDCSANSAHQTTVLAWYTDVKHSIKPITSGYRLALSYNVYHTKNALRPSLPTNHSAVTALRHVLLSWKQMNRLDAPRKMIYLLDHQYSQANKTGSALKGLDAHKMAILQMLAKQHGFRLGLASLETYIAGSADDEFGGYGGYSRRVSFGDVGEQTTKITNLTDLDGHFIKDVVDFDEENNECIPRELTDAVENGKVDKEEYEGYSGNEAGSLERWYRRTVLIIWPLKFDINKTLDDDVEDAIEQLNKVSTSTARKSERKLVDFLFDYMEAESSTHSGIAPAICHAACQWSDRELFLEALETCGIHGVGSLNHADVALAASAFGLDTVKPFVEDMLSTEKLNAHRFRFLDDLEATCVTLDEPLKGQVLEWLAGQRKWCFGHLLPFQKDDKQLLLDTAYSNGGLPLLRDTFVPQIKAIAGPSFISRFAMLLHAELLKADTTEDDKAALAQIVSDLLTTAISKIDFFAKTKEIAPPRPSYTYYSTQKPSKVADPQTTMRYIDICLRTGNEGLVEAIVGRLTDVAGVAPAVLYERADGVLLPLLPLVVAKTDARPADAPVVPGMQRLFDQTIQIYLRSLSHANPSEENVRTLIRLCILRGGTGLLVNTIWPALKHTHSSVMLAFLREVKEKRAQIPVSEGAASIDWLILDIVKRIIKKSAMQGYQMTRSVIDLLKLCASNGHPELYGSVLIRLMDKTAINTDNISNVLVPLIPALRQFLVDQKTPIYAEPFASLFTTIVGAWTKHILGPKPASATSNVITRLEGHRCSCRECASAFNWLANGSGKSLALNRIGAQSRKHLEKELTACATGAATWTMLPGKPQGLRIVKSDAIYAPVEWRARHAKGTSILKSIGTDQQELRRVFGAHYQVIMGALDGSGTLQNQAANLPFRAPAAPVVPAPAAGPSTGGAQPGHSGTTSQHASSSALPTRKRKASYDPSTVIDLSNDSP
ncbi:hypothetical protein EV715DRAFT_245605 [Schizophyllum commune]